MKDKKSVNPFSLLLGFAKPHKGGFIASVILAICGVTSGIVPYFCAVNIIIALLSDFGITATSNEAHSLQFYSLWCCIGAVCYVLKAILMALSTKTSHEATFNVLSEVRRAIAEKLTRVPMGYIVNTPSGLLKNGMVERIEQMEVPLAHIIPELSSNLLISIAIIVILFFIDWRMALVSIVTIPIGLVCYVGMMKEYPKKYAQVVKAGNDMSSVTVEYIGGIEVIKAFNQADKSYKRFEETVNTNKNLILDWMHDTQKYSAVMMSVWPAVLISVLPVGCLFYMNGSLPIPDFLLIIILSLGIIGPIVAAMFFTDEIAKIGTVMSEINGILSQKELVRPESSNPIHEYSIKFSDVHFAYNEDEVLKRININIPQGKTTALVGPSGSGKSTIAKLIASFWDASKGEITIGGVNIKEISVDESANLISYVSQDNYLFNETIRENIRMGKPTASDFEVEEIAKKSGCHDFIMKLENGYDTITGGAGGHLSGGERQRIAIARAMMKDAPIVILDEATSYTDPENEVVIQKSINNLTKGKTLVVIAHRLSTIVNSEQIIVVKNGNIEASGTHNELLEKCSLYKKMWESHIGGTK